MILEIHPANPQKRLLEQAAAILRSGGILVYPTDSSYALCCMVGNGSGMERIRAIRQAGKEHYFSLICQDLSELSHYALVDNRQYRLLKAVLPGAYTFILKGSREIPKKLLMPKRNTIGLRIPNHIITQNLLATLGEPLLSTTLKIPEYDIPNLNDALTIEDCVGKRVDAIIDGGACTLLPTTVIDLSSGSPEIIREGQAPVDLFL